MRVYRQTDSYSCGPRSLQIAFSHYDFYPKYNDLLKKCKTDPIMGTEVDDLEAAVQYYGFDADVYEDDATSGMIKNYTDLSYPVIVMWYAGDDNHVSVAYEVDEKYVYLMDPSLHLYTEPIIMMRRKMLEKCWKKHDDSKWIMAIMPKER